MDALATQIKKLASLIHEKIDAFIMKHVQTEIKNVMYYGLMFPTNYMKVIAQQDKWSGDT